MKMARSSTTAAKPRDYMTDVLSRAAVKFIQKSQGAPFFIEIATFAPHAPLYSGAA